MAFFIIKWNSIIFPNITIRKDNSANKKIDIGIVVKSSL